MPAVISRKPIHLLTDEERKQVVKLEDLWLDIGAKTKDEAKELVRIGDPVTLKLGFQEMRNGLANSPAMDNKCGLWVVIEALRRAAQRDLKVGRVRRLDRRRGDRPPRGADQRLRRRSARRHRRRCDPRHRLPHDRQAAAGGIALGSGPVIFRGPNMNPVVVERLIETGPENRDPAPADRQRPGPAERQPTPCRSAGPAWRPAWSAFPTATCTAPSK